MTTTEKSHEIQPSDPAGKENRAGKKVIRLAITIFMLLVSITLSANRLGSEISDRSSTGSDPAFALQAACANAGLSADAAGRCYNTDPRGLTDAELTAALVPAPVQPPGDPAVSPGNAPAAPVSPPLVVPPAPAGLKGNPRPLLPTDTDNTVDPLQASPGTPLAPGTPIAPGAPAAPGAPTAPGSPATPGTPVAPGVPVAPGNPPGQGDGTQTNPGQPSGDADGPQPVVVRETIRLTLPFGLDPDPQPVGMTTTGGVVDVGAAATGCTGWAGADPDIVLRYTDASGSEAGTSGQPIRIFFEASSAEPFNASIIVNDPYGRWWCNDDWETGSPDPMLTFIDAGYGVYDIWVGAPARGTGPGGIVFITERPINPRN